jgi:hypothetical protein
VKKVKVLPTGGRKGFSPSLHFTHGSLRGSVKIRAIGVQMIDLKN